MSETLQLEQLTESLQQLLGESLFAIYLYGSAVDGGLGPESDLDVLVVVNQALTLHQRQQLAETLLKISYPIGAAQRALEVTIVLKEQILSGSYPLSYELQFGEWLREELNQGALLRAHTDPDLSILLKKAQMSEMPEMSKYSQGTESYQQFAVRIAEMLLQPEKFRELYPLLEKAGYK